MNSVGNNNLWFLYVELANSCGEATSNIPCVAMFMCAPPTEFIPWKLWNSYGTVLVQLPQGASPCTIVKAAIAYIQVEKIISLK